MTPAPLSTLLTTLCLALAAAAPLPSLAEVSVSTPPESTQPDASISEFERGAEAEARLLDIVLREKTFFSQIEERPESYDQAALEEGIDTLIEAYANYNAEHPGDPMAMILHGKLLMMVGLREAAMELFLQADQVDPNIAVLKQQIGNYLAEQNEGIAALPFFLHAVELEPKEAVYHYQVGELLYQFKDTFLEEGVLDQAALERAMINGFSQAAHLEPANFDLQMRYGESFYDLTEPEWTEALGHWRQMEKRFTEILEEEIILLHQARVLVEMARYSEALGALRYVRNQNLRASRESVEKRIPAGTVAPPEED